MYPLSVVTQARRLLHSRDFAFEDAHEYLLSFLDLFCESAFNVDIRHSVRCARCSYVTSKIEHNGELQLSMASSSIAKCLEAFHQEQDIEEFRCPRCTVSSVSKEFYQVTVSSKVLVVVLKRFSINGLRVLKDTRPVLSDEVLNLGGTPYRLTASIQHIGSVDSGHYTARVKKGNTWFHCNDARVIRLSERHFLDDYVLIYVKS